MNKDHIVEYNVASSPFEDTLIRKVNDAIRDGWQPFGGICSDDGKLIQPMVLWENKEEKNTERLKDILPKKIDDIILKDMKGWMSIRASNCLKAENIITLGDLHGKSIEYLKKIPNLGKKSLQEVINYIETVNEQYGVNIYLTA